MNPKAPQLVAGDANVAIDLAQDNEWVLDAMSTIRGRLPGCSLLVPPTVSEVQRLGFELASFDLAAPVIATPREIVRKFFR